MQKITAEAFMAKRAKDLSIPVLDVRTPAEFALGRLLEGSIVNIPLDRLNAGLVIEAFPDRTGPLYLMCHTQNRATMAATKLEAEGLTQLVVIEGGYEVCGRIWREMRRAQ